MCFFADMLGHSRTKDSNLAAKTFYYLRKNISIKDFFTQLACSFLITSADLCFGDIKWFMQMTGRHFFKIIKMLQLSYPFQTDQIYLIAIWDNLLTLIVSSFSQTAANCSVPSTATETISSGLLCFSCSNSDIN